MQNLIPLREFTQTREVKTLTEESGDGKEKNLYIQGVFLEGDVKNRNGRIYPVPMLTNSIEEFKKNKIRGVGVPGELNHPQSSIQIDLERVSHYITELNMDGNQGIGKAKIATTPKGCIAKALIDDGMILGVSTRGVGKLDEDERGNNIVSEFELITVDIVSDPSAPNAFVEAVMESLQYYVDSDTKDIKLATTVEQLLQEIRGNLTVLPKKQERKNEKIFQNINSILQRL